MFRGGLFIAYSVPHTVGLFLGGVCNCNDLHDQHVTISIRVTLQCALASGQLVPHDYCFSNFSWLFFPFFIKTILDFSVVKIQQQLRVILRLHETEGRITT